LDEQYKEVCPDTVFFNTLSRVLKLDLNEDEREIIRAKYSGPSRYELNMVKLRQVLETIQKEKLRGMPPMV
jgi:hypothetical protein